MVIDRQVGDDLPNRWICALIGNGSSRTGLFIGYLVGAGIMLIGGLVEVFLGVNAAGKSLEQITKPLTSVEEKAPATPAVARPHRVRRTQWGCRALRRDA